MLKTLCPRKRIMRFNWVLFCYNLVVSIQEFKLGDLKVWLLYNLLTKLEKTLLHLYNVLIRYCQTEEVSVDKKSR